MMPREIAAEIAEQFELSDPSGENLQTGNGLVCFHVCGGKHFQGDAN